MIAKIPELVGLTEIAQRAGVQKPVVAMWRVRDQTFPESVADLRVGAIFWWPDVQVWLTRTGRRSDAGWTIEQVNASTDRQRRLRPTQIETP